MDVLQYTYSPKTQDIVCLRVCRQEGFSRYRIHMHDHHELVLVPSKTVFRVINNGSEVSLEGPCFLLNRAGSFHEVVEISEGDYESLVINFHPRVLNHVPEDMLYEKQLLSNDLLAVSLTQTHLEMLRPLFLLIADRPYGQQRPLVLAVLSAADQILREGAAAVHLQVADHYIFRVIELIRSGKENLSVAQLSQRFHVCPTKLKSDFRRIVGMPVMSYRNVLRLQKARDLLISTDMGLSQIAYACGFSDESYFIRCFRNAYHVTPSAFRKQERKSAQEGIHQIR